MAQLHDHGMDVTPHRPHADLIDAYLRHLARQLRRAERTVETYGEILHLAHRQLPYGLALASDDEIADWLAESPAAKTQALRTTAVRGFFAWAHGRGYLTCDPTTQLTRPQVPRRFVPPATDDQVATVLTRCHGLVLLAAVLATYQGMRCVEVTRLHRDHVTDQDILVSGKGGRDRLLPTHPQVWQAVRDLRGRVVGTDPRLLKSRTWRAFHRAGADTSMHRLRKWCATRMLQSGHDLATVQDFLGHASPNTTRLYATPSAAQMRHALAALPDLTGHGRHAAPLAAAR